MISVLTGNNNVRLLAEVSPKEIAEKWQKSMGIDVGDVFKKIEVIKYWECSTTGFRWYSPDDAAGGSELYAQLAKFDWYYMVDKWEFSVAMNLLKRCSTVLEVGVGAGHFMQAARKRGHSVQGVELNPKGAERARALGFDVYELMLDEMKKQTDLRFDAICSFQVLEHVPNPRQFIEGMIGLLKKPGGKIILSVPNAAVMRKIDPHNQDLLNQPPHHMGHWDEKVFRALEGLFPVNVKSVHREPLASYHVGWMTNGYLRNSLSPLGKTIPQLLVNRYTTLPLQWLMYAGLRKYFPGHTILVELEVQ